MSHRKLKFNDLKVGMEVSVDQLSEIYDILVIVLSENIGDKVGTIAFIGESNSNDPRAKAAFNSGKVISPIYHDSSEEDYGVYYDE